MFNENLFSERFLIKSIRLNNWDYANLGYYFITICTRNKLKYFGDINNGKMMLSNIGKIADQCWRKIPLHFNNVKLDAFIAMPNHVHGIIQIINQKPVETRYIASLHETHTYNKFGPLKPKSLPAIIHAYKSACTREINKLPNQLRFFHWQPRYYDHIIRSEKLLNIIRRYIENNSRNWARDRNFR